MEHLQTIRKKAEIPPFLYFLYFVSASALLMSGGVLRFPVTVFSLLDNSVYFCIVPPAVSSLLGIQRLLLYRSLLPPAAHSFDRTSFAPGKEKRPVREGGH